MQIKFANIEEDCQDLEQEVEELRGKINRMLKDEKIDKETAEREHNKELNNYISDNQKVTEDLKILLTTFQELPTNEDDV